MEVRTTILEKANVDDMTVINESFYTYKTTL